MDEAKGAVRRTLAQAKAFLAQEAPPRLSEADTKANFIEPIVAALGWAGIGAVTREYYVKNSQEFIDYVMAGPSGRLLAVEAKPLQANLTDKYAAQLVQYCAVEGIEWAALTNGRELQFFNTFLKPDLAAKRVLALDLLAFNDDPEFEALFAQLWQLSRESMTTPTGVRTWLKQRRLDATLRSILLDPTSPTLKQLRKALAQAEIGVSSQDVVQWFRGHLAPSTAALPISVAHATPLTPSPGPTIVDLPPAKDSGDPEVGAPIPFDPAAAIFAGGKGVLLPLFGALREAVDGRWPETVWRAKKHYVAAEAEGRTFLAIKTRSGGLVVALALPPEIQDGRLSGDAHEFNWSRMTRSAAVESAQRIDNGLLALVGAAREHAAGGKKASTFFGVKLRDLLDTGLLTPTTALVLVAKGNRDVARAALNAAGEIVWHGTPYRSPSDKAFAPLLGVSNFNGWEYWQAELPEGRATLAEVRARLLAHGDDGPSATAQTIGVPALRSQTTSG